MNALAPLPSTLSSNELHGFLRSRRSIRFYKPNVPDPVVLERLFLTAGMAPSAHNRQPWRYAVIVETGDKQKLAEAMGDRLVQDRTRDGDTEDAIKADVERSCRRVVDAPVVVIVALTLADMDRYPDAARMRAEYLMAVQSTAMATQNLLLAAHAEGLGACWMCAPLFCPDTVRAVLNLSANWEPQGLLTLGYPARPGKLKPRPPLSAFVQDLRTPGHGAACLPSPPSEEFSSATSGTQHFLDSPHFNSANFISSVA
jgi:coenzyme F420-0:L-glutamate ligase / coenzyme F420-1:gamma-L-glutamate ligase